MQIRTKCQYLLILFVTFLILFILWLIIDNLQKIGFAVTDKSLLNFVISREIQAVDAAESLLKQAKDEQLRIMAEKYITDHKQTIQDFENLLTNIKNNE